MVGVTISRVVTRNWLLLRLTEVGSFCFEISSEGGIFRPGHSSKALMVVRHNILQRTHAVVAVLAARPLALL